MIVSNAIAPRCSCIAGGLERRAGRRLFEPVGRGEALAAAAAADDVERVAAVVDVAEGVRAAREAEEAKEVVVERHRDVERHASGTGSPPAGARTAGR